MGTSTDKGYPYPESTDDDKPRIDIEALALFVSGRPGIQAVTTAQRNELTELWAGQVIFNLTTGELQLNPTGTAGVWYSIFTSVAPLPINRGGTGLAVAPSMLVNLGSTAAASPLQASPRPGVTGVLGTANGGTGGTLPVANGGTGATTVAAARNALGLGNTAGPVPVASGGTGAANAEDARTALGITPANIGAATSGHGHALTDANITGTLPVNQGGTGATTAAGARNALGLGNTSGPVPVANGGTGAATAADARSALGVTPANIGAATSGHGHALTDANITGTLPVNQGGTGATTAAGARNALGLGNTTGDLPIANGGTGASTASDARANLGAASAGHGHSLNDANITGTLPVSQGGTGATTAAAARNAFGLGNTTGDLPVANGGTGASTASDARANLGAASASHGHSLTDANITGTLPVNQGGTGATNATAARANLDAARTAHDHDRIYDSSTRYLQITTDEDGPRLFGPPGLVYDRTYTLPANAYITNAGTFGRATSLKSAKLDVEDQEIDPLAILNIHPRTWIDRGSVQRAIAGGYDDPEKRVRAFGAVVEEVLPYAPYLVTTDADGAPDGLAYDRVAVALIPTLRALVERVCALEGTPAPEWAEAPEYDDTETWAAIAQLAEE